MEKPVVYLRTVVCDMFNKHFQNISIDVKDNNNLQYSSEVSQSIYPVAVTEVGNIKINIKSEYSNRCDVLF